MIRPNELKLELPMEVAGGAFSTTIKVWEILRASYDGDLQEVKRLGDECPELLYAQYNYTPPVLLAVIREHTDTVMYLLEHGAHDPDYRTYPFQDRLQTLARDRGVSEIEDLLNTYEKDQSISKMTGDNGRILFVRTPLQQEFEQAVERNETEIVRKILKVHPEFASDETFFWGEGILLFAAKENNREMIDLLMRHGARVPEVLKWAQFYYFERFDGAAYMMEKGMKPDTMNWQHVTILHDMAQKGFIDKAGLLVSYGADLNRIDDVYQSTPLGLAARWGNYDMARYLLEQGADPNKAGAAWATPLAWARKRGHDEIERLLAGAGGL